MRDYLVFGLVFALLPFIVMRPVLGVMGFTWISLMNPHRLAYGTAYNFPFAALIAGLTLVSMFFKPDPKRLPITPVTVTLLVFMAWMTLTGLSAFEPEYAWPEWNRVMKTLFMVLITMVAIYTEKDLKMFAWVVGLSLGFYGFKGGTFTLMSGGSYRVMGPDNTYISDNNDLALALLTTVPLIVYLRSQVTSRWLRLGLAGLVMLTMTSVIGSYSRGALLGSLTMLGVMWLKSASKIRTGIVLGTVLPIVYMLLPEQWFGRMETIDDYQADGSAMGRINSWHTAYNIAADNFMGGGFRTFTQPVFMQYAPDPLDVHAPHSIYFQVLGEHGFIGLGIFLLMLFLAWRTGVRVIKFCKGKEELKWASGLATACQVSLAGYLVGGAFLSLAYFDLLYNIIIMLVLLEKLLLLKAPDGPPNKAAPDGAPNKAAPPVPAAERPQRGRSA